MNTSNDWGAIPAPLWPVLDRIFDDEWYRSVNRDLRRVKSGADHYRKHGFVEGRSPSPLFDPAWYRQTSRAPAIAEPLFQHWLLGDPSERGEPNPLFDSKWIMRGFDASAHALTVYLDNPGIDPCIVFDTAWATENQDGHSDRTALETYLRFDTTVDWSPCPLLDAAHYRAERPQAMRALEDYVYAGGFNGVSPSSRLDARAYVEQSPWTLVGGDPPLVHFLRYGVAERTAWNPLGTEVLICDLLDAGDLASALFIHRRSREAERGRHCTGSVLEVDRDSRGVDGNAMVCAGAVVDVQRGAVLPAGAGQTNDIVVRSDGHFASVVWPLDSPAIDEPLILQSTGFEFQDVQAALLSTSLTAVPAASMPPQREEVSTRSVLPIFNGAWVRASAGVIIATPTPTTSATGAAADLDSTATLRVTSRWRCASEVVWPPASDDDRDRIHAAAALDVDADVPTSALIMASTCRVVAVRTPRGRSDDRWATACAERGIECVFVSELNHRRIRGTTPTVGVVIAAYNHESWISEALTSVLAQTHPPSEVLVVDDGSTDGTRDVIATFAADGVSVMTTDRAGPASALNAGIAQMSSDLVAFLGSDDAALPQRTEHDIWILDDPSLSAVASLPVIMDETGKMLADSAAAFLFPGDAPRDPADVLRVLWRDGNFICHPAVTMRRSDYWRFGGSPPGLIHLHDFMLWVRIAGDLRLACSGERTTRYRRSRAGGSLSARAGNRRLRAELEWSFARFFDTCSSEAFAAAFAIDATVGNSGGWNPEIDSVPMYLDHPFGFVRRTGYLRALALMEDGDARRILRECHGLGERELFDRGESIDIDGMDDCDRLLGALAVRPPWHLSNGD